MPTSIIHRSQFQMQLSVLNNLTHQFAFSNIQSSQLAKVTSALAGSSFDVLFRLGCPCKGYEVYFKLFRIYSALSSFWYCLVSQLIPCFVQTGQRLTPLYSLADYSATLLSFNVHVLHSCIPA
jgi:hypothetical protein